ncbi:MAG: 3'-5' exonuclease, partial [Parafannyhessea umbonata]|nr:3'-5' exonuclease [Parafannyhessea umbonata]
MGRKRPHRGNRRRPGREGKRKAHVLLTGTLRVMRPGVAEVQTSEGTFPVARGGIREGMSGDEVQVSLQDARGREKLARVQNVVSRATTTFLGVYRRLDPLGAVVPLDARIKRDFFVIPEDPCAARLGVGEGDVVSARITEYPGRH